MTKSEKQTIRECIEATQGHAVLIRSPKFRGDDLGDVLAGMDITISKLESLLKPTRKKKPCKGCTHCTCQ